jgi:hypothetical protein
MCARIAARSHGAIPRASAAGICSLHRNPSDAESVWTVALSARVTIRSETKQPNPLRAGAFDGMAPAKRAVAAPAGRQKSPEKFEAFLRQVLSMRRTLSC